jgi:hypothetical protein
MPVTQQKAQYYITPAPGPGYAHEHVPMTCMANTVYTGVSFIVSQRTQRALAEVLSWPRQSLSNALNDRSAHSYVLVVVSTLSGTACATSLSVGLHNNVLYRPFAVLAWTPGQFFRWLVCAHVVPTADVVSCVVSVDAFPSSARATIP